METPTSGSKADPVAVAHPTTAFSDWRLSVKPLRCPNCRKLLAKCAVHGIVEIVCTRCRAVVRTTFT